MTAWIERFRWAILLILTGIYFAGTVAGAASKPIWLDEFFSLVLVRLPTLGKEWQAILAPADYTPPLFHLLTRAAFVVGGGNLISFRLPAMVGFWVMCLSLYLFVSRRLGPVAGLAAFLAPILTLMEYYAYEARGYGLMLGFSGLAMLAWQRRAPIWCGLCLCCAVLSHTYAIFVVIAFGAGELIRVAQERRVHWGMWAAFLSLLAPVAGCYHILSKAGATSGSGFDVARWALIPQFYSDLLYTFWPCGIIIAAMAAWLFFFRTGGEGQERKLPNDELAFALGLFILPIVVASAMVVTGGYFNNRYAAGACIGFAIVLASAVTAPRRIGPALMVLALLTEIGFVAKLERSRFHYLRKPTMTMSDTVEQSDLTVYAHDFFLYTDLITGWPPEQARKVAYVLDPELTLHYIHHQILEELLLHYAPWTPMRIEDYKTLQSGPREFLVCYAPGQKSWLLGRLAEDGDQIELVEQRGELMVYRVTQR